VPKKAVIIDGEGKFLMPGLAEMHAHIPVADGADDSAVRETLFLYLSRGVTTIRGMLGDPYHLALKKQVGLGAVLSPRIFTSSPSCNGNTLRTPEEARQKVIKYHADGYDFLKIHPGILRPVFDELVKTSREVGITFSGHVPQNVGIRHALESRYASIDHIDGYLEGLVSDEVKMAQTDPGFFGYHYVEQADEKIIAALAQRTHLQGVWVVPTQSLFTRWFSPTNEAVLANDPEMQYMPAKTRFQWRQSKASLTTSQPTYNEAQWKRMIELRQQILRALHQAGVPLLLGSDAPQVFNVPGFSLQHEMKAMQDAGLSPLVILQSGTLNPARFFKQSEEFGSVAPGRSADLILVDGNPLDNLDNVWKQSGVMLRGKWLDRTNIQAELAKISKRHE
jgi:Amidohydrolase family